jgi:hypothetical protein
MMYRLLPLLLLSCAATAAQAQSDDWKFSLSPYLWAATVKGTTSADGTNPPPINPGYNFFSLDNLDGFAFLQFSAAKGQWSIKSDFIYVSFADDINFLSRGTNIDMTAKSLELSAGFRPASWPNTELIFGLRGLNLNVDVVTPGPIGNDQRTWVDPIVGIQHVQPLGERWRFIGRFDIGGFGVASESTLNAFAGAGYRFNDTFSMVFGYRYLSFEFRDEDFAADLEVLGYGLGFQFSF